MRDLISLIPSKDIREYLKKINYQFDFGTAFDLVQWQIHVDMPIKERHSLLKEFKTAFKNEETSYDKVIEGLHIETTTHDIIDRIINREEFSINNFKNNYNNEYVYYYKFIKKNKFEGMQAGEKCDNYEDCLANIKNEIEKRKANNDMNSFDRINITRENKNGKHTESVMTLNKNLDIIDISYTGNTDEDWAREKYESFLTPDYFGESPSVPAPFKDEDLVCSVDEPENVMMLTTYGAKRDDLNMYDFYELKIDADNEFYAASFDPFEYGWSSDWIQLEYFKGNLEINKEKINKLKEEMNRIKQKTNQ